ncbi:MAG: hypothetical protein Q8P24_18030 [Desulfobacterales bacterium]|nr:hypothetical protein [Desulfobacterales bacterium]
MRAVEVVIKVSPDGSAVIHTGNLLKPGQHKIMIITDEAAISEGNRLIKKQKQLLELKPIRMKGWPKNSTFRREEIYHDNGR